jgi:hypothetical protein
MDKKIRELMKVCHTFELKLPTDIQIRKILGTMENIPISIKPKIVEYIQGDLRKLIFIKKIYDKNPGLLNEEIINTIFHMKSYSEDSKNITSHLINTPTPLSQHNLIMNETDRTIIALLWHENIVDPISELDKRKTLPFYQRVLDNICFADFIDRITFQNQIWQFNEMSSLIKTFYNNKIYHETFFDNNNINNINKTPEKHIINKCDIRFTKVLTKYSTEYNNSIFIYDLCQKLDMDRPDLITFFQELRLRLGENIMRSNNTMDTIFEEYNISKLDIKRLYRYLDKNVKKEIVLEEDSSDLGDD